MRVESNRAKRAIRPPLETMVAVNARYQAAVKDMHEKMIKNIRSGSRTMRPSLVLTL
jgi:hypothetical protein